MVAKLVFVIGGVVSGLGKGIATAFLGCLLKSHGLCTTMQKLDPYLNVDLDMMNLFQYGEAFITDDGAEIDLDLGHYKRFIDESLTRDSSMTSGRVYWSVLWKERSDDYGGAAIWVIPHTTNETRSRIAAGKENVDVAIIGVDDTMGDIESQLFLEVIRQSATEISRSNYLSIHVMLASYLAVPHEQRTKSTQHNVKGLFSIGIQLGIIVLRFEPPVGGDQERKITLLCNVKKNCVIQNLDLPLLYSMSLALKEERLDDVVRKHSGLDIHGMGLTKWIKIVSTATTLTETATITMVGKYVDLHGAYLSVTEALTHDGINNHVKADIRWIDFELIMPENMAEVPEGVQGILVPGDSGQHGIEGETTVIRHVRERKVPFSGTCLSAQMVVVEYSRHAPGLEDASPAELGPQANNPIINLTPGQKDVIQLGGTMRLGRYSCKLLVGNKASEPYDEQLLTSERHHHRYEVNNDYRDRLEAVEVIFCDGSPDNRIVEVVELPNHLWFMGVQFHPEFKSCPNRPHPLFRGFIGTAGEHKREISVGQHHLEQ